MSALVQVQMLTGWIDRVKPRTTPIVELSLEPHQRLVSIEMHKAAFASADRKTTDWCWTAYVETRL